MPQGFQPFYSGSCNVEFSVVISHFKDKNWDILSSLKNGEIKVLLWRWNLEREGIHSWGFLIKTWIFREEYYIKFLYFYGRLHSWKWFFCQTLRNVLYITLSLVRIKKSFVVVSLLLNSTGKICFPLFDGKVFFLLSFSCNVLSWQYSLFFA